MSKEYIPIEDCKDGYLYIIGARNSDLGVYVAKDKGFVINRFKINRHFLFVEFHWDTGSPYGTARCIKELEKAGEFPWEGCDRVSCNKETAQKMLDYLTAKGLEYDMAYTRIARYALTHFDEEFLANPKTAIDRSMGMWGRLENEEVDKRLRKTLELRAEELKSKELDK